MPVAHYHIGYGQITEFSVVVLMGQAGIGAGSATRLEINQQMKYRERLNRPSAACYPAPHRRTG